MGGSRMETADAVVIGGGVIGASVAYHLALAGWTKVCVLDAGSEPGEGSTGRATGGFRAQFGTRVNVELSVFSREKLRSFQEETGVDPGYRSCGYLFLATSSAQLHALRKAQAVQRAAGLSEVVEVSPEEIKMLNPAIAAEDTVGGSYCPTDGFTRPLRILQGYLDAASRLGVRFQYGCRAEGLILGGGEGSRAVCGVRSSGGDISSPWVVNAAGPWAAGVSELAGVDTPVRPERRQVASTVAQYALPEDMPMTVETGTGFHFRVRDGHVLLLWPQDRKSDVPFDISFDPGWLAPLWRRAQKRIPGLAAIDIDRNACWAGLYEMSPDHHAILGPARGVQGLMIVAGSSGHGVMHSPALGVLAAEMMTGARRLSLDVHALRPERFHEGEPNSEASLL